jgi:hypothetical protein
MKNLREHAEEWWIEQGKIVPVRDSPEYEIMYEDWVDFAFQDFLETVLRK